MPLTPHNPSTSLALSVCRNCHTITTELTLRCPICQSCFQSATMIAVCCHVYCQDCLRKCRPMKACAVCKQKCSHRSLVEAPAMDLLVQRFKETARAFGLSTARYDASLALTQLPPESSSLSSSMDMGNAGAYLCQVQYRCQSQQGLARTA